MYYVYMIRCIDKSIYTGITTHPQRRFQEHLIGHKKAAKYTRTHPVVKFVAKWTCDNRQQASQLEYWLKKLSKKQKENIIQDDKYFALYLDQHIQREFYTRIVLKEGDEYNDN